MVQAALSYSIYASEFLFDDSHGSQTHDYEDEKSDIESSRLVVGKGFLSSPYYEMSKEERYVACALKNLWVWRV